jgi:hypothetical protein
VHHVPKPTTGRQPVTRGRVFLPLKLLVTEETNLTTATRLVDFRDRCEDFRDRCKDFREAHQRVWSCVGSMKLARTKRWVVSCADLAPRMYGLQIYMQELKAYERIKNYGTRLLGTSNLKPVHYHVPWVS